LYFTWESLFTGLDYWTGLLDSPKMAVEATLLESVEVKVHIMIFNEKTRKAVILNRKQTLAFVDYG